MCLHCNALSCSELSVQLTQLQTELGESRAALSTALETEQGQSSTARQALANRIDEIKAQVLKPDCTIVATGYQLPQF